MPIFSQHVLFAQEFYTSEKSFECKEFRKNFNCHLFFSHHKRTHSKEKLSECKESVEIVGTLYLTKKQRIQYSNKCNECKEYWKAFIHCSQPKHLRIYNGEKLYECKECGKTFNYGSGLILHLFIISISLLMVNL